MSQCFGSIAAPDASVNGAAAGWMPSRRKLGETRSSSPSSSSMEKVRSGSPPTRGQPASSRTWEAGAGTFSHRRPNSQESHSVRPVPLVPSVPWGRERWERCSRSGFLDLTDASLDIGDLEVVLVEELVRALDVQGRKLLASVARLGCPFQKLLHPVLGRQRICQEMQLGFDLLGVRGTEAVSQASYQLC